MFFKILFISGISYTQNYWAIWSDTRLASKFAKLDEVSRSMKIPCWLSETDKSNEITLIPNICSESKFRTITPFCSCCFVYFTFLNVSRVHKMRPKHSKLIGCCVSIKNTMYNRIKSIGNKCQPHCISSSSNRTNALDSI